MRELCLAVNSSAGRKWRKHVRHALRGLATCSGSKPFQPGNFTQRHETCLRTAGGTASDQGLSAAPGHRRRMAEAGERPIDPQLSYVPVRSPEGQAYLKAMAAAANFALCNRCAGGTMLCRRCCLTRNGWSTLQGFPLLPTLDPGVQLPALCCPTQDGDIGCLCGTAV